MHLRAQSGRDDDSSDETPPMSALGRRRPAAKRRLWVEGGRSQIMPRR